jgi:hypothetical protein
LLGLRDEKGIFVIFSTRGCFYKFATILYMFPADSRQIRLVRWGPVSFRLFASSAANI